MITTPRNQFLRELSKDKNINFYSVTYSLSYKGTPYEIKYHNSFNVCYSVYISVNNVQVKHYDTYSAPSIKQSVELIEEYLKSPLTT